MDCGSAGWGLSDSCLSRVEVLNQEQFLLPSLPQPQDIWQCLETFFFGEGNGAPLQYSCLESPMDGGAWWAAVHGVAESRT